MSSRDQPLVFECIQDMWTYRHGEPRRVKVDREFHKPGLKEALGVGVLRYQPVVIRIRASAQRRVMKQH